MPTLFSWSRGANLHGVSGLRVAEATGGGAPTATVELNVADNTRREDVLKALQVIRDKVIESQNVW